MSRLDNEIVEAQARKDERNRAEKAAKEVASRKAREEWKKRICTDFPRLSAAVEFQTAGEGYTYWTEFTVENRVWQISFHDGTYMLKTDPDTCLYKDVRYIKQAEFEDEFILFIALIRDNDRQPENF